MLQGCDGGTGSIRESIDTRRLEPGAWIPFVSLRFDELATTTAKAWGLRRKCLGNECGCIRVTNWTGDRDGTMADGRARAHGDH